MDQDATWYAGRPQPRRHCVRWGPSSPLKKGGQSPCPILPHVYCGQAGGWMKMSLGVEVGLEPSNIVLDGDQAPLLQKRGRATPQIFSPCLLRSNGWMHQDQQEQ